MEKYIYNEQNGLHYELVGDYYFPLLTIPEEPPLGIWGAAQAPLSKRASSGDLQHHAPVRQTVLPFGRSRSAGQRAACQTNKANGSKGWDQ